jgi:hypothetical protein
VTTDLTRRNGKTRADTSGARLRQPCEVGCHDDPFSALSPITTVVDMAPATAVPPADPPGPHPSYIQVAKPFLFEQKVQSQIIATGANPAREDTFRLQGVQWIDEVRRALQLSVYLGSAR